MSERLSRGSEFPVPVYFDANAMEVAANFPDEPTAELLRCAQAMVPVHGTSLADAVKILRAGAIESHAALKLGARPGKPSPHLTDRLDTELGQDEYTFWSVGKTGPVPFFPVYFCATPSLVKRSDSFVAMHDMAELGALVSREGQEMWQRYHPGEDVAERNRQAIDRFFKSLVRGRDFGSIFGKFLATHYPSASDDPTHDPNALLYWTDMTFPGTQLNLEDYGHETIVNAWAGPQLQTRGQVSLANVHTIIITDPQIKGIPELKQPKYRHITVAYGEEAARRMQYSLGPYHGAGMGTDGFCQSAYANMIIYKLTAGFYNHPARQNKPPRKK